MDQATLDYVEAIKARHAGTSPKYRSSEHLPAPTELTLEDTATFGGEAPDISFADDWTLQGHEVAGYEAELRRYKAEFDTTSGVTWWAAMSPAGFGSAEPKRLGSYRRKEKAMPSATTVTMIDSVDPDELRDKPIAEFASKMRDNDTHLRYIDYVDAASMTLPKADDYWVDGVWQTEDFVLDNWAA